MSGSSTATSGGAYALRLMPGYTTRGVVLIEGMCRLKTLTVNLEFARRVSACSNGMSAVVGANHTGTTYWSSLPPIGPLVGDRVASEGYRASSVPPHTRLPRVVCPGSGSRIGRAYARRCGGRGCTSTAGRQSRHHMRARRDRGGIG